MSYNSQIFLVFMIIIIRSFNSTQPIWGARVAQWVIRSLDLTTHISLSPIWRRFAPSFVNYKKGCTRLAAASDKVYQLLSQGRWFSLGTLASSTTKNWSPWYSRNTAESGVKTQLINQSITTNLMEFWQYLRLMVLVF